MTRLIHESKYIDIDTYKQISEVEFFPGDEQFDSILFSYEKELIYSVKAPKKERSIKNSTKRKAKEIKPCSNCGNNDKKMLKSRSFEGVKTTHCLRCGYRS